MPNFQLPDSVFERAAGQFPTPFFLYDEKGIRAAIHELKSAFSWAPHFMEYFAVKALPNPRILQLFVDEGFGSLDEESLAAAMKALTSLADGNRLVGIISHVAELKERIDRQIVVTKEKSGGSLVRIV